MRVLIQRKEQVLETNLLKSITILTKLFMLMVYILDNYMVKTIPLLQPLHYQMGNLIGANQ